MTTITFQTILKAEKSLLSIPFDKTPYLYYKQREQFVVILAEYIRAEAFSTLPAKKLLKLCALVGTYRPMALHTFFIHCSNIINK